MGGEESLVEARRGEKGRRRPELDPDTYSGTTCLICGFTLSVHCFGCRGRGGRGGGGAGAMVMRTKVTGSSQGSRHPTMQSAPPPHSPLCHGAHQG